MVNLELFKIFITVAETKNITKASEILNISQPAISKHIQNLEFHLGNPLFIRTKKGVVLNECGEKLYLKAKQALTLLEEAEKEISKYKNLDKGTVKIGISTTLTKKYLLKHMESFHKAYPNIIIDINTDPTKELLKQLKSGTIDIIISKFPTTTDMDLKYIKLGKTKYIFVTSKKYIELTKKIITPYDLTKYPILLQKPPTNSRESVDKYFKENNVKITPIMNIASSNLLIDFLISNYGIGYVTKLYVDNELQEKKLFEIKIKPSTETINYGIILLKNNIMTSHCKKFIEFLKEND